MILTATGRLSRVSVARQTSPNPPEPIRWSSRYRPAISSNPAESDIHAGYPRGAGLTMRQAFRARREGSSP